MLRTIILASLMALTALMVMLAIVPTVAVAQTPRKSGLTISWLNNHNAMMGRGAVEIYDYSQIRNMMRNSRDLTAAAWLYKVNATTTANAITFTSAAADNRVGQYLGYVAPAVATGDTVTMSAIVSNAANKTFRFGYRNSGGTATISADFTSSATPTTYTLTIVMGAAATLPDNVRTAGNANQGFFIYNGSGGGTGVLTVACIQVEWGARTSPCQTTTDGQTLDNVLMPGSLDIIQGPTTAANADDPIYFGNAYAVFNTSMRTSGSRTTVLEGNVATSMISAVEMPAGGGNDKIIWEYGNTVANQIISVAATAAGKVHLVTWGATFELAPTYSVGTWQTISMTKAGTSVVGWVDGVKKTTSVWAAPNVTWAAGMNAVGCWAGFGLPFIGKIGQVTVYSRTVLAYEIAKQHRALKRYNAWKGFTIP